MSLSTATKLTTDRDYILSATPISPTATILRSALKDAITDASRAMAGKSSLPILSTILLRAEPNRLCLSATNLTLAIQRCIAAKSSESWALCIPGKLLFDIVSALPDAEVTLELLTTTTIRLSCGNFETTLKGLEDADFPSLPQVSEGTSVALSTKDVIAAIKGTACCAATDDTRPVLQGILLAATACNATWYAADGYQLAKLPIALDAPVSTPIAEILPAESLRALAPLFTAYVSITLTITPTMAIFHADGMHAITRLIDGKYPDIERIIPTAYKVRATLKRSDLEAALKLAALFAAQANNVVRVSIGKAGIILTANAAEVGDQKAEIDATVCGQPMQIAFNARFAREIIAVLSTDKLTLETQSPESPIVIRPVGTDTTYILMPMTVK